MEAQIWLAELVRPRNQMTLVGDTGGVYVLRGGMR